ncbi:MAG: DUF3105 domain-containing protein [Actinomycetota bacterium]
MAKKRDPATKAQRRELAQQRRLEEMRRRARATRMRRLRNIAIAVVVIGGLSALIVSNARKGARGTQDLNRLAAAAGCTALQTPPEEGRSHQPPYTYKQNPPTSGSHRGPGPTGVFREPIQDEDYVHNLEHGHVGIQYKDFGGSVVDELEKIVRGDPTHLFIAPRPQLDAKLALTAWNRLITCQALTAEAVQVAERFAKQFAGQGPENVPGTPRGV